MSRGAAPLRTALRSLRREWLAAAGVSAVANLLLLTPTLYLLQVYDRVLVSRNELTLAAVSAVALLLLAFMALAERTRSRLLVYAGLRLDEQLAQGLFDASLRANLAGDTGAAGRAFADLLQLRQFLTGTGLFAVFDAPWCPVYVLVCFLLHPLLGALALGFALAQCALAWAVHARSAAAAEAAGRCATDALLDARSKLRRAQVLEPLGMADRLMASWRRRHETALRRASSAQATSQGLGAASRWLRNAQASLGLAAGALLVIDGQISAACMIAANMLLARALAPIDQLVTGWRGLATARAAYLRLKALLCAHGEPPPGTHQARPMGSVTLRDAGARAPGLERPLLQGVDLSVAAGTNVVVLGPSGSGKTTLLRTLLGLAPHPTGQVLLDEVPIAEWDRAALGPHLGYLAQEVELFDGTIAENIARFGEVDAARVVEAAHCAGLHETVLRLPGGYDAPLGEGGRLLAAGMRQRIGLARAVYGCPALVVLDEPNAHLDGAGETALTTTLRRLKSAGSTVFLVTQRPGAIASADWLVLLEAGRLRASGPRSAVLEMLRVQQASAARALSV